MKLQHINENFYKISTVLAITALIGFNSHVFVKAEQDSVQSNGPDNLQETVQESESLSPTLPNIPNGSCIDNLNMWDGGSSTFNSNAPYAMLFMRDQNSLRGSYFQDINGDNLSDYIIYNHQGSGASEFRSSGCVYLHNGTGWDLAYQCVSVVFMNTATGQITSQNYKGDCAG